MIWIGCDPGERIPRELPKRHFEAYVVAIKERRNEALQRERCVGDDRVLLSRPAFTGSAFERNDDRGQVYGTLVIVTEMTERVVAARRLAALAYLSFALSTSRADAFETLRQLALRWPADVPFSMICAGTRSSPVRASRW